MTDDVLKLIKYRFGQVEEVIVNADRFIKEAHRVLDEMQKQN